MRGLHVSPFDAWRVQDTLHTMTLRVVAASRAARVAVQRLRLAPPDFGRRCLLGIDYPSDDAMRAMGARMAPPVFSIRVGEGVLPAHLHRVMRRKDAPFVFATSYGKDVTTVDCWPTHNTDREGREFTRVRVAVGWNATPESVVAGIEALCARLQAAAVADDAARDSSDASDGHAGGSGRGGSGGSGGSGRSGGSGERRK